MARFLTAIELLRKELGPSLLFFSGDAFSPSSLSLVTKGRQMVPLLNRLGISAACIGNHDFDFGVDNLVELIGDCNFPWLMSNVVDVESKQPLAMANTKHVVHLNGVKVSY